MFYFPITLPSYLISLIRNSHFELNELISFNQRQRDQNLHLNALDQSCQSSVEFYLTKTQDQRPLHLTVFIKNETGSKIRRPLFFFHVRRLDGERSLTTCPQRSRFDDNDRNMNYTVKPLRQTHSCLNITLNFRIPLVPLNNDKE